MSDTPANLTAGIAAMKAADAKLTGVQARAAALKKWPHLKAFCKPAPAREIPAPIEASQKR